MLELAQRRFPLAFGEAPARPIPTAVLHALMSLVSLADWLARPSTSACRGARVLPGPSGPTKIAPPTLQIRRQIPCQCWPWRGPSAHTARLERVDRSSDADSPAAGDVRGRGCLWRPALCRGRHRQRQDRGRLWPVRPAPGVGPLRRPALRFADAGRSARDLLPHTSPRRDEAWDPSGTRSCSPCPAMTIRPSPRAISTAARASRSAGRNIKAACSRWPGSPSARSTRRFGRWHACRTLSSAGSVSHAR